MKQRLCAYCANEILSVRNRRTVFCSVRCRVASHRNPVPVELREEPRWVNWSPKKVPLDPKTGLAASSTNPLSWADYDTARSASQRVGFVLGDGIACIDIDGCLDADGRPNEATQKILELYPHNYIEISPSGNGLHIWGYAPEMTGFRKVWQGQIIEFYSRSRYITVTANPYQRGTLQPL